MKDDDDEDQTDRGLHQVQHYPALLHEQHIADEHPDAGHAQLSQHSHSHGCPLGAHLQPGLDPLLVGFDVFFEFARKKLTHLRVDAIHVGDEGEQSHQHQQQDG